LILLSRENSMRRTNWKTVSTLVTALVIAGCMDNVISSPQATSATTVSRMLAPAGAPSLSLNGTSSANTSADFTVTSKGGTFLVGNHAVVFPASSICDPATSSYGPGTWDSPCDPAKDPIAIHAEVRTTKAGTWIDFTPALRFVPAKSAKDYVWIVMYNPNLVGATDLSKFGILYSPALGAMPVADANDDPTSKTYIDTFGATATRRIKHFSGWWNSSGRSCNPETDADCTQSEGNGGELK
jgi:hypothetical protein